MWLQQLERNLVTYMNLVDSEAFALKYELVVEDAKRPIRQLASEFYH